MVFKLRSDANIYHWYVGVCVFCMSARFAYKVSLTLAAEMLVCVGVMVICLDHLNYDVHINVKIMLPVHCV